MLIIFKKQIMRKNTENSLFLYSKTVFSVKDTLYILYFL